MLDSLPAKKPVRWWEKNASSKVNLLAQQAQLLPDTRVDCVLDIKALKKQDIWNTDTAKEMFLYLLKFLKAV